MFTKQTGTQLKSATPHPQLALLVLTAAACLSAQTATPVRPVGAEETVELSPFQVRADRDTGWVASSSLAGTRTNEQLVNLPISVDAITSEFIQDMGAFTLEDAAAFVANVNTTSLLETKVDDGRSSYRGMDIGGRAYGQSARNFFLWYAPTDNYNVERIDFNKGSNSLMFGDTSPGGQAATYTKRARPANFAKVMALYGTYGTNREQFDINRRLGERAALRLNLVNRSDRTYIDFSESNLRALDGALTWRLLKNTTLRLEGEAGKFTRERASNNLTVRTSSAPGLGYSTNNRWYYTTDGAIVQRTSSAPTAIDRAGVGGNVVSLLEGQSAAVSLTTQAGSTTVPTGRTVTFSGLRRSVNILGVHDFLDRPYTNATAWLEQTIGKLGLEFAYNQQNQHQDRNDSAFPTTISVDSNGRPFMDSDIGYRVFGNRVKIGRFTAAYPIELGRWMKQYLVFSSLWQKDFNYNQRRNLANLAVLDAGPATITNHRVTVRAYLDDPAFPSYAFYDRLTPEKLPVTSTFRAGWINTTDANLPFTDVRYSRNWSLSSSGSYWGDRLNSLLGVRFDRFSRKRVTTIVNDATGQPIDPGTPDAAPAAYSYDPNFNLRRYSYTGGLVYRLTSWLNAYGTYSESFRWQGQQLFDGTEAGAVLGQTREIGLKGNAWDNRLFFTLAAYRVKRLHSAYSWGTGTITTAQLEDVFNPNNVLAGDPAYFRIATGVNNETTSVTADEESKGFEATFQFQRVRGVQARFTLAHNRVEAQRDFSHFKTLLNAALARTNAALAPGGNAALAENATYLANAQTVLAANDGVSSVTGNRGVPWSVNWALDYEFPRGGALKGIRLGLYGNWRDNYILDIVDGTNYRGDSQHPVGTYALYQRKIFKQVTTFRLGVRNLIDLVHTSDYRHTGVSYVAPDSTPIYNYRYRDPILADFTVTVDF